MHDAMADGCGELSDLGAQEGNDPVECFRHAIDFGGRPRLVDESFPVDTSRDQVRLYADALDLPFQAPVKLVASRDRK
jgi:hypothetical protein